MRISNDVLLKMESGMYERAIEGVDMDNISIGMALKRQREREREREGEREREREREGGEENVNLKDGK